MNSALATSPVGFAAGNPVNHNGKPAIHVTNTDMTNSHIGNQVNLIRRSSINSFLSATLELDLDSQSKVMETLASLNPTINSSKPSKSSRP